MRTWDVIIIGGGIIGLSLAIALRKRGAQVLIVERREPGREASSAAAGMLADGMLETPALEPLASASARMYPEFVHELQDESGVSVDLRDHGTVLLLPPRLPEGGSYPLPDGLLPAQLSDLEPALAVSEYRAFYLNERSVDPRALAKAALKSARHRSVDISSATAATAVLISDGRVCGVRTARSSYSARAVVNCAGAWACQLSPHAFPTRPVKGQMLSVVGLPRGALSHVVRSPDVYLVPRSDGRILIGSTVEEAGYDKRTDPGTIRHLHDLGLELLPALAQARRLEAWAGLRPGTPDGLPILGAARTPGYFAATGHFRDGILLAPITAHVMAQVIAGSTPDYDLSRFSPLRFTD